MNIHITIMYSYPLMENGAWILSTPLSIKAMMSGYGYPYREFDLEMSVTDVILRTRCKKVRKIKTDRWQMTGLAPSWIVSRRQCGGAFVVSSKARCWELTWSRLTLSSALSSKYSNYTAISRSAHDAQSSHTFKFPTVTSGILLPPDEYAYVACDCYYRISIR